MVRQPTDPADPGQCPKSGRGPAATSWLGDDGLEVNPARLFLGLGAVALIVFGDVDSIYPLTGCGVFVFGPITAYRAHRTGTASMSGASVLVKVAAVLAALLHHRHERHRDLIVRRPDHLLTLVRNGIE
jgi:hypothetical protein